MKALAISHVPFEHPGSCAEALRARGFEIEQVPACELDFAALDPLAPDLVIVLGGPIGVPDGAIFPFIAGEIALIQARIAAGRPTLGICLGAQMIAAAAGSRVYPGGNGKEIGWFPLSPGEDAAAHPFFAPLLQPGLPVLHWHGDTFDLPAGAAHLAASALYPSQAFMLGHHTLALQFHPEVSAAMLEHWYIGHIGELAQTGIDVNALRRQSETLAPRLEDAARGFWEGWLTLAFG
jgi:GMP synthase (glutamine-hydrolysing)